MSGLLRKGLILLAAAAALVGCGGSGGGGSDSGGTTPTPAEKVIALKVVDASGNALSTITASQPGRVIATVTQGGSPVAGTNVTFSLSPTDTGSLSVATRATDASGNAEVQLLAGTKSGGVTITATSDTATASTAVNIEVAPAVASLDLVSSKLDLPSSGADNVELTAIVKDANNIGVEGVQVQFSASSGELTVVNGTTDASGKAKATLTTSGDKSNRIIHVSVTTPSASTLSDSVDVNVTGTNIVINAPSSLVLSNSATINLALKDSDNTGISDQPLVVTSSLGNALSNASPKTGSDGSVDINYTGSNSGSDTLTVTAFDGSVVGQAVINVSSDDFVLAKVSPSGDVPLTSSATIEATWKVNGTPQVGKTITFTTTRGSLSTSSAVTDASGVASISISSSNAGKALVSATSGTGGPSAQVEFEFVATSAATISVDASPKSIGPNNQKSTISATVRDASGNLVKGKTVDFTLNDVSGGTISPASAVTDSNGQATTVYASNAVTAADGVTVTGTVRGTSLSSSVKLTVAERNLFITLGTGNEIIKDSTSYTKQFLVFVTDANSAPRPGVTLNISAVPVAPDVLRNPADSSSPAYNGYFKGVYIADAAAKQWVATYSATTGGYPGCLNEDADKDGILDQGEDYNSNGKLTPGNVVSVEGTVITGSDGTAILNVRYPKQYGNWTRINLIAKTSVTGTESSANSIFVLPVAVDDVNDLNKAPPGVPSEGGYISPFGSASDCSDPS